MSLRRQLLLVSLLLLSLPWAGCQFIREMEGALRQGQAQSLQATAQAVAAVAGSRETLIYPHPGRRGAVREERPTVYAFPAAGPVIVDGYGDGWDDIDGIALQGDADGAPLAIEVRAQTRGGYLYLLFHIRDPAVVYHNPGLSPEPNGDRLVLRLWPNGKRQDHVVATAAPGSVRAEAGNRRQRGIDPGRVRGYWQDAVGGFTLELEVPLEYTGGRLGFFFIDEDGRSGNPTRSLGNMQPLDTAPPPWLIYRPDTLQASLAPFAALGGRIQVLDREGWLVADLPAAPAAAGTGDDTFWLLRLLYRSILSTRDLEAPPTARRAGKLRGAEIETALAGNATTRRYRDADYATRTVLSAAAPVRDADGVLGAVVVRQSGETYLSLTDQAFSRLLGYSLLALTVGALGLLGYATLLSWRIRRLSRAAGAAISEDGRVRGNFPRATAQDEIGELSRQYADLLERLREYNDYLHSLSRKLSHELRTPVAVIQSSLDNLEHAGEGDSDDAVYRQRAREGLLRLQGILTAMSEASRLEESIWNNTPSEFDLVPLLREVFEVYRGVYTDHTLQLAVAPDSAVVTGAADLLVQALDKLMDNAAAFCPAGGRIGVQLASHDRDWRLQVTNEGPGLPAGARERMFEPMVSLREGSADAVHLGLGLHIVRLIVAFHHGSVRADNLPGGDGVVVTIDLPRLDILHNPSSPVLLRHSSS